MRLMQEFWKSWGGEYACKLKKMRWNHQSISQALALLLRYGVVIWKALLPAGPRDLFCFQSTNQGGEGRFCKRRHFGVPVAGLGSVLMTCKSGITRHGSCALFSLGIYWGGAFLRMAMWKLLIRFGIGRPCHWLKKCGLFAFELSSRFFVFRVKVLRVNFFCG